MLDKENDNKIVDILKDTTKFKILGSVDEFDKTAIEEQRLECQLLGYYKKHLIPKKNYKKKFTQLDHKNHVCGSPKYTDLILC